MEGNATREERRNLDRYIGSIKTMKNGMTLRVVERNSEDSNYHDVIDINTGMRYNRVSLQQWLKGDLTCRKHSKRVGGRVFKFRNTITEYRIVKSTRTFGIIEFDNYRLYIHSHLASILSHPFFSATELNKMQGYFMYLIDDVPYYLCNGSIVDYNTMYASGARAGLCRLRKLELLSKGVKV